MHWRMLLPECMWGDMERVSLFSIVRVGVLSAFLEVHFGQLDMVEYRA